MALSAPSHTEGVSDLDSLKWEDLPPKDRGESHADAVFVEVGRALSTWEILESVFAMVFSQLSEGSRGDGLPHAAGRVYGFVTAGQMRMQMLLEVAEIYTVYVNRDFDLKHLQKVMKHYTSAARSRNNIAHGLVTNWTSSDGAGLGYFLGPSLYLTKGNIRVDKWSSSGKGESRPVSPAWKYCYTGADIAHFRGQYEVLQTQVQLVLNSLIKWRGEELLRIAQRQMAEPAAVSVVIHGAPTNAEALPSPLSEP